MLTLYLNLPTIGSGRIDQATSRFYVRIRENASLLGFPFTSRILGLAPLYSSLVAATRREFNW
jgi:hypothetical protein